MTRHPTLRWLRLLGLSLLSAVVLSAAPATASQDITIVSKLTTKKGQPRTSTQYLTSSKVRTAEGSSDTIFDYQAATMTFIDHNKKQYWKTTPEEIRATFAELQEMLDSNPMLKRMFGKDVAASVEKTGQTRQVAGYTCVEYHATMGKSYEFDFCAAPDLEVPIQYHEARRVFYTTMGPMAGRLEKLLDEMQKIEGFPLATTFSMRMMGQEFESTSEATEVKLGPVPADAFDVPDGYKEKKSPYAKKK